MGLYWSDAGARAGTVFAPPLGGAELSAMFRLRTIVLLWIARKVWARVRPALERRLRGHHRANR